MDDEGVVHLTISGSRGKKAAGPAPSRSSPKSEGETHSVRESRLAPIIAQAASYYKIPEALVRGIIRVESNFHPRAVSRAGALGLMQLMPATARAMQVPNPFDSRQNIFGGCRYLRLLLNRFDGDLVLTLAAYNAGEGAVLRQRGIPYARTAGYIQSVLDHYDRYRRREMAR